MLGTPLAQLPFLEHLPPTERARFRLEDGTVLWWPGPDEALNVRILFGLPE
ncbi:MAG: DUF2442 domain-containing protein [Chloroflexota bacterium]|nr:DUF2442 domain-containing protein [Chloroflexota bacterium]